MVAIIRIGQTAHIVLVIDAAVAAAHRHFYASWLLAEPGRGGKGTSLTDAQYLLGHSSIMVTGDTYGHMLPTRGDEAAEYAQAERALLE